MSTGHCFCFNQTSVPRCKSRNDISCLQKKSLAYGWKVCALKTHVQTGEVDQTPRLGLMCVGWGENDNLMLEIQHRDGNAKCGRLVSLFDERYQIAFEGFPLFPFYVSFSLFSLPPPPSLSLPPSHCLTVGFALNFPSTACVCALNSSNCSFEGQSHKMSFYAGPVSLMGLSLCTMLCSELQKLQTAMTTPTQTDRQIAGRPHE